jgi:hypothetical protein
MSVVPTRKTTRALVDWYRVDADRKDGPRKERLHSLSHSNIFLILNLGWEKTKVWTSFANIFET